MEEARRQSEGVAGARRRLYHSRMSERVGTGDVAVLVLGVGNAMKGDDGLGPCVAGRLAEARAGKPSGMAAPILAIDCGTTPENYTAVIRRVHPDLLVIVDAAEMGLGAGECRVIPPERAGALGLSTHSMPLSLFVDYVRELAGEIRIVGVQPSSMRFGEQLSAEATAACETLAAMLAGGRLGEVRTLD